jgi:hypothetical protein
LLIAYGLDSLAKSLSRIMILPAIGLVASAYRTQKFLRVLDMRRNRGRWQEKMLRQNNAPVKGVTAEMAAWALISFPWIVPSD